MIQILRAKLHGIHVTGSDLNYHGSITIDAAILELSGIVPLEFVYIWNKSNGERLQTYVLPGERNSRCCILNGAAARLCQKGDPMIVCAYEFVESAATLRTKQPSVLIFSEDNTVSERLCYHVHDNQSLSIDPQ